MPIIIGTISGLILSVYCMPSVSIYLIVKMNVWQISMLSDSEEEMLWWN